MDARRWNEFVCLTNCIMQKVGGEHVTSAGISDWGGCDLHVTPETFERLSRGRTVSQSIGREYNHRSFRVADAKVTALYPIPQPGDTTMPGDAIELCCECGPDDGTVISDDEAIRVLSQQTVLVAEATCDA